MHESLIMGKPETIHKRTPKPRNSNIEFLRIVAMLMVLMLHVNFFSIGKPSETEYLVKPLESITRISFELICIISVNLFVFISGWFGINAKLKSICRFLFQCVFIVLIVSVIGECCGFVAPTLDAFAKTIFRASGNWFIIAYLFLYIFSPILNSFCKTASERNIRYFLIFFYVLQTLFGNIAYIAPYCSDGYSAFSFMGIYVLARYMNLYGERFQKYGLYIYVLSTLGLIVMFCIPYITDSGSILQRMCLSYTSPLNIMACAGLSVWVAHLKPRHNRVINFIASSAFTVYLVHMCTRWTMLEYRNISADIYQTFSGIQYLFVIGSFIVGVYLISIILDQIRLLCWKLIEKIWK